MEKSIKLSFRASIDRLNSEPVSREGLAIHPPAACSSVSTVMIDLPDASTPEGAWSRRPMRC